ncbi:MAG: MATE family efflux transporter [Devosia sp.]|uniref:MATE family efflux transporter n=1 Tax=Devosia sp. TaxID=1871048 RepID=UPI001A5B762E|nr:MATE family efflux transporter [Devosia sp.]MBL8597704.1 MATE family efflux transporter [Devosia sp.]
MNEYQPALASSADRPLSSQSWGTEFRALFLLAWPLIIAQLARSALFTTDVIVLGRLGADYVAAGALANALFICVQLFGIGVVGAVAPLAAQALGAKDRRTVRRTVRSGIWLAIVLAIVLFPLAWNIGPIYRWMGQDPELIALAEIFVHAAIWLLPPAFVFMALQSFLNAHGDTRAVLLITVGGVVVNLAANYALVFGHWGFPALGIMGSGLATSVVNYAMLAFAIGYIQLNRRFRRYHIWHNFFRFDWERFFTLIKIGLPIGFMLLAEVALFTTASLLQGWLGKDELAAHSVALTIASLAFMVPLGLSQATTVRVGIALGEKNKVGIGHAGWAALVMALGFMAVTAIVFFVFAHPIVGLFLNSGMSENQAPLMLAASFLVVAGLFQLFDGAQVTMAAALRGMSDTNMPLIIALVGYWLIGFPVAWWLGMHTPLRGTGVWFGLMAGLAAVATVLTVRWAMRERLGLTMREPS